MNLKEKLAIIELISKTESELHEFESNENLSNPYVKDILAKKNDRIKMYVEMAKDLQ